MVSSREVVDIVELAFYSPVLLATIYVCYRHGIGRQQGWLYLGILAILRLIAAGTGIGYIHDPSNSTLIQCSIICYGIGLSPLLLALLGILQRLHEGMKGRGLASRQIRIISIPLLVGLILGIVAGTKEYDDDPSSRTTGQQLQEGAVILFLVGYLLLAALTLFTVVKKNHILEGEQRLLAAAVVSLPFLLVRIIWSLISAFDHNYSGDFSLLADSNTAVVIWAIMSVLMEFIVVLLYLFAGLFVRVIPRHMVNEGYAQPPRYGHTTDVPMQKV